MLVPLIFQRAPYLTAALLKRSQPCLFSFLGCWGRGFPQPRPRLGAGQGWLTLGVASAPGCDACPLPWCSLVGAGVTTALGIGTGHWRMAHGTRHKTQGTWHMACGTWHKAHGTWHTAHGMWHMAHGAWHTAHGTGRTAHGTRHVGTWCMAQGTRHMAQGTLARGAWHKAQGTPHMAHGAQHMARQHVTHSAATPPPPPRPREFLVSLRACRAASSSISKH